MKNILITGASGLIGTYLTKRLNKEKDFKINKIDRGFRDICGQFKSKKINKLGFKMVS